MLAVTIVLLIVMTVTIQAQVPEVTYIWSPPTIGTPAVSYTVQLNIDGSGWTTIGTAQDTTYSFNDFNYGTQYEVRVAGVDSLNRQGPFSNSSDPFIPDMGIPGQPSKPVIIQLD